MDIDDTALADAARELGTNTTKDTVNAALTFAAGRGKRAAEQVSSIYDFWGEDISNPEIMKQARR